MVSSKGDGDKHKKSKKDHAYPGRRQMGRQREFICRAMNDGFEHVAIVGYAVRETSQAT
jgi:hypothetical protein